MSRYRGKPRFPSVTSLPSALCRTLRSGLPGFQTTSWHGIVVPAKTPKAAVDRLHAELAKIASHTDVREKLRAQGADVVGSSPAQFAALIKSESAKWGDVVRRTGIKAE